MDSRIRSNFWMNVLRSTWVIFALLSIGLFIFSVITQNSVYKMPCPSSGCVDFGQLTNKELAELQKIGISATSYAWFKTVMNFIIGFGFFSVGIFLFWKKSHDKFFLFASLVIIAYGANYGMDHLSQAFPVTISFTKWVDFLSSGMMIFFFIFPNGKFVPKWTIYVSIVWLVISFGRVFMPGTFLSPESWPFWLDISAWSGFYIVAFGAQIYRFKKVSTASEKQQAKWLIISIAVVILHIVWVGFFDQTEGALFKIFVSFAMSVTIIIIPLSLAIAILQYKLWELDFYINRFVVYIMLSGIIVIIYASIVGMLETITHHQSFLVSFFAAGMIAVLFQPIREKLQISVNRLMYGESRSPYTALSMLGKRLEATTDAQTVLPSAVETIGQVLKLPYAAIFISKGNSLKLAASYGAPHTQQMSFDLVYQKEKIGELIIGSRTSNEGFSELEHRLIQDIVRQVGIATYSVKVTTDLIQSREHLVKAREEERKRIRRDLHDGLGPQLVSLGMNIEAARSLYKENPAKADEILTKSWNQLQNSIIEIRQLVYALRPPILDELGLVFAVNELIMQYGNSPIKFKFTSPSRITFLPAAIEVAAFRVIQESIVNVIRHSKASECTVKLTLNDHLQVEITDNGKGISSAAKKGIGLLSMRERTEELSGSFEVMSTPHHGTRIQAIFPLSEKEVQDD